MSHLDKFEKYSIIKYVKEKIGRKKMIAKMWKKILLFILLIACLFNIVIKIVNKSSLNDELQSSAQYVQEQEAKNKIK